MDIPILVDHLIRKLNGRLGKAFSGADGEAGEALLSHSWKGNIRELENVLERAMLFADGEIIRRDHLPHYLTVSRNGARAIETLRQAVERFERRYVSEIVELAQSDKKKAAKALGISLASLYRKLEHNGKKSPSHT
jgi:transcriptional regulator with PAS, ATPase and Fis domain